MNKSVSCLPVVFCLLLLVPLTLVPEIFACVQTDGNELESSPKQEDSANAENEIEVVQFSPVIVLKGQINGNDANVIFDTGSWPNAIGSHRKSELKGRIDKIGPTEKQNEVCDWENLRVGQFKSTSSGRIGLVDFSQLNESFGIGIDAIAGTPFAVGRVFEIDFEKKTFHINDSSNGAFYEIVKDLEFDKLGKPWVRLAIENSKEKFVIDTGFDGFFAVDEKLAERLKENGFASGNEKVTMQVYSDGFKTREKVAMSIAKQIVFGYEFNNVPVIVSKGSNTPNSIGLGLLKCFDVSLDLKRGKLRLNKNGNYSLPKGCTVTPK